MSISQLAAEVGDYLPGDGSGGSSGGGFNLSGGISSTWGTETARRPRSRRRAVGPRWSPVLEPAVDRGHVIAAIGGQERAAHHLPAREPGRDLAGIPAERRQLETVAAEVRLDAEGLGRPAVEHRLVGEDQAATRRHHPTHLVEQGGRSG